MLDLGALHKATGIMLAIIVGIAVFVIVLNIPKGRS